MGGHSKRYPVISIITLDVTVDTSAYAVGDQIGDDAVEISNAVILKEQESIVLRSIMAIDNADVKAGIDLLFFSSQPTVAGSDNGAANVATSELDSKLLAAARLEADCYSSLGGSSNAFGLISNLWLPMRPTTSSLWVLPVIQTAVTYGASTDLRLKLGFSEE